MGSSRKKASNKTPKKDGNTDNSCDQKSGQSNSDKKVKKLWGEELNDDSIYTIFLKKITYSVHYQQMDSLKLDDNNDNIQDCITRCDQTDNSLLKNPKRTTTWYDDQQVCRLPLILSVNIRSNYFLLYDQGKFSIETQI